MSSPIKCLVFGSHLDPHVKKVCSELRALGAEAEILDHEKSEHFRISLGKNDYGSIYINNSLFNPDVIWDRRKLHPKGKMTFQEWQNFTIRRMQWNAIYDNIIYLNNSILYNSRMIPNPDGAKFLQVKIARELGFLVPRGLLAADISELKCDSEIPKSCITKSVGSITIPYYDYKKNNLILWFHTVVTSPIDISSNNYTNDKYIRIPIFVQEKIDKKYELRIIAIKNISFTFRIDSQKSALTSIDWRWGVDLSNTRFFHINVYTENLLQNFLDEFGLKYGVFDLAVDADDNCWFLECNAEGQWSAEDKLIEGEISRAFAKDIYRFGKHLGGADQSGRRQ